MKKFFSDIKEYRYKKRLGKFFKVKFKLAFRSARRLFKSGKLASPHFVIALVSVFVMAALGFVTSLFPKYATPFFETDARIIRRLSLTEYDTGIAYLRSLEALGSSNRIQVTLKTEKENYIKPLGTALTGGGINITLTFSDGTSSEFALNNKSFQSFTSGSENTYTLILPFGYTPFDITDYKLNILPDINNTYDSWHCSWARAYFLLGGKPTLLAKESWSGKAVFGGGEDEIQNSSLEIVTGDNADYLQTKNIYGYYLTLAKNGMTDFADAKVKSDALDMLGINGGTFLYADVETATIDLQDEFLTYYTKGTDIPETDSLDYDGRMFLDIDFYGKKSVSLLLDTLGTDDFELAGTSSFKLELPSGYTVFDIRAVSLRAENPNDAFAPRFVRLYIKPDYTDMLEIARITDRKLVADYTTPVFYKNLIDAPVPFDLTVKYAINPAVKKQVEKEKNFTFGKNVSKMYFESLNFYERQSLFYERMTELYNKEAYEVADD